MIDEIIRKGTVSAKELRQLENAYHAPEGCVRILDATFVLPGSPEKPQENFNAHRIPGARFFDIEKIADPASLLPHTVPTKDVFEADLSALGINPEDLVVLYGQHGMTMGPCRVWWTFRLFGHDRVCVLDGGLPEWIRQAGRLETEPPLPCAPSQYRVKKVRNELLVKRDDVAAAMESGLCPILDARPRARFEGNAAEPRPGMLSGHIPGSLCMPASELVDPETGTLKPDEELKNLLLQTGFDPDHPDARKTITTCGSGITACVIALALFRQGFDKIAVYDGSWAEWGQESSGNKIACGT